MLHDIDPAAYPHPAIVAADRNELLLPTPTQFRGADDSRRHHNTAERFLQTASTRCTAHHCSPAPAPVRPRQATCRTSPRAAVPNSCDVNSGITYDVNSAVNI